MSQEHVAQEVVDTHEMVVVHRAFRREAQLTADHRALVVEHLDDEEMRLLPLANRYLTQPERDALGEHL